MLTTTQRIILGGAILIAAAAAEAQPTVIPPVAGGVRLINATPIGMANDPNTPISEVEMALLPSQAIAYDLIYTPRPTKFLQMAAARGLVAIDGLEMLINQGAIALEFWLDQPVPIEIMRRSLTTALCV